MLNDNIIIDFMQMAIRYSNQNLTLRNYNEIDNTLCPQLTITVASIKATGVKKMIVNRSCSWILHASSIGNAQRLVHRMCTLPLGCKGLINGHWFVRKKGSEQLSIKPLQKKRHYQNFSCDMENLNAVKCNLTELTTKSISILWKSGFFANAHAS